MQNDFTDSRFIFGNYFKKRLLKYRLIYLYIVRKYKGEEVMNLEQLVQAISTVGFPIFAFLLVFWKFDKSLGLLTEAVNNNTQAVQILLERGKNN